MKAIRTRYYGATNFKGSKIVASDGDKNAISISYPHGLNPDKAHELAAYLLMQKMGWPNQLVGGGFQNDQFWTMLPMLGDRDDRHFGGGGFQNDQFWTMLPMVGETYEGMYVTRANPAFKQFLTSPEIVAEYAA